MSIVSVRTVITLTVLGAAVAALASCKKADSASDSQSLLGKNSPLGSAVANATRGKTPDPCTLLSANEAEVYVGVLGSPPYRATDNGVADASGELCMYRGTDGRQITLDRIDGGGSAGQAISDVPNAVDGAGKLAATTHRVPADVPNGPWDHATWNPGGSMMVTKGELAVNIDVTGASGKEDDAVAIARQIVPRFAHPLD